MIDDASVQALIGRWWFNYDEGNFEVLSALVTDAVHFSCRTDTGTTDYEEFVRADVTGREAMIGWQRRHRLDSPYPLRHNGTNVHTTGQSGDEAAFASYIFVTHIVEGVSNLSTGIVHGSVTNEEGKLRISDLNVILDTMASKPLREVRPALA